MIISLKSIIFRACVLTHISLQLDAYSPTYLLGSITKYQHVLVIRWHSHASHLAWSTGGSRTEHNIKCGYTLTTFKYRRIIRLSLRAHSGSKRICRHCGNDVYLGSINRLKGWSQWECWGGNILLKVRLRFRLFSSSHDEERK